MSSGKVSRNNSVLVLFPEIARQWHPTKNGSLTPDTVPPGSGKIVGYVPGNIVIISHLVNTIKQDCTDPEVFIRLAEYVQRFLCKIQCQ